MKLDTKISKPKISVVIPLYNSEKFIETALESVLLQNFQDFELLLIDDCSTDRTLEIVSRYEDSRIKVFRQLKNSGESASRNLGIKVAEGKYIYFMDHDDAILPETLETFYRAAEESQAEVVFMNSWYDTHDSEFKLPSIIEIKKSRWNDPEPRFLTSNLVERLQIEYMGKKSYVTPWLKIQRLDFLHDNNIYFPLTTLNGDVLFHFAELAYGHRMQVIDACCYVRRIHPNRTMDAPDEVQLRKACQSLSPAIKYLREVISRIQIPDQFRIDIEAEAVERYMRLYVKRAYRGELSIEQVDCILKEVSSADSDVTRTLINVLGMLH